jgi:hypothetical protein
MLDTCYSTCQNLELTFSSKNCIVSVLENNIKNSFSPMRLRSDKINWTHQLSYLEVQINAGKAYRLILVLVGKLFSMPVIVFMLQQNLMNRLHLALQERYCKPILACGIVAVHLTVEQLRILNSYWNGVYKKIFCFNNWESIRAFMSGLGRLDLHHIYPVLHAKFDNHLIQIRNCILNGLYFIYCESECKIDVGLSMAQFFFRILRQRIYNKNLLQMYFVV